MPAQVISGSEIAKQIREELKEEIAGLKEQHNLVPGLVTVLVGEDPASQVYVGAKEKTSKALGLYSERHDLAADTSEEALLALISRLNRDPKIHGILVQLPLPKHINETRAVSQQLLVRSGIEIEGAEVVVVGRSNIVGKPIANILLQKKEGANATVTVCHTRTRDISVHTKRADIIIVAAGRPKAITADMVKEGVVVIDVGVNRIGKTAEGKAILVGDVDFEAVKEKARAITPVPGGVGPMTITMLMLNTVKAAKLAAGLI